MSLSLRRSRKPPQTGCQHRGRESLRRFFMASMLRITGARTTSARADARSVRRREPTTVSRWNLMGQRAGPARPALSIGCDAQPGPDVPAAGLPSLPRARAPANRECHWSPARDSRDRRPGRSTAIFGKARPVDPNKDSAAATSLPARARRVQEPSGHHHVRSAQPGPIVCCARVETCERRGAPPGGASATNQALIVALSEVERIKRLDRAPRPLTM